MLNALLIGNPASASGHRLKRVKLAGHWILNLEELSTVDVDAVDIIAIFGGDGTMQHSLSQLLHQRGNRPLPPIAVLPFGTTNMNAKDINQAQGQRQTVETLQRIINGDKFPSLDRPLVRVVDGGSVHHGFFFGAGVIAKAIEQLNAGKKPGPIGNQLFSFWAMLSGLRSASAATDVVLNGAHHSIYVLMATTLDKLLFGCRPYWGEAESGSLRLTWVEADAPHLLRHAPGLLRGSPGLADKDGYESQAIERATLELSSPYILDGEIFQPSGGCITIEQSEPIHWVVL